MGSDPGVVFPTKGRWPSRPGALVFAVNAGNNSISAFRIDGGTVDFVATTPSGGLTPVSLAVYDDLLYVLNQGSDAITGFPNPRQRSPGGATRFHAAVERCRASSSGALNCCSPVVAIFSSRRENSAARSAYRSGRRHRPAGSIPAVVRPVPFGFAVDWRDRLAVSEAGGSNVTSYARHHG